MSDKDNEREFFDQDRVEPLRRSDRRHRQKFANPFRNVRKKDNFQNESQHFDEQKDSLSRSWVLAENHENMVEEKTKSLKKKLPELRDAIDGFITPEQAGKLKIIKDHYDNLESRKAELEELILALAAPYQQELAILQTAPGISSDFTAIGIISEIGTNMEAFPSAKHLCSWAGLTPTNNESAGKKKSVRVSKAGCYIKPLLVQCANAVVKSTKHPEMRNRYLRLKKRRGHKKAIIAIARMLLTALYHMLKNGENYNAELYRKSDLPPVDREITVEQALMIARNQGYKIKSATA